MNEIVTKARSQCEKRIKEARNVCQEFIIDEFNKLKRDVSDDLAGFGVSLIQQVQEWENDHCYKYKSRRDVGSDSKDKMQTSSGPSSKKV